MKIKSILKNYSNNLAIKIIKIQNNKKKKLLYRYIQIYMVNLYIPQLYINELVLHLTLKKRLL